MRAATEADGDAGLSEFVVFASSAVLAAFYTAAATGGAALVDATGLILPWMAAAGMAFHTGHRMFHFAILAAWVIGFILLANGILPLTG